MPRDVDKGVYNKTTYKEYKFLSYKIHPDSELKCSSICGA
jgi:hypothetical protein